ncbi:MAG: DUF1145 domain-containing protein [Deltaproteobacteria bacterium]|nr:DUF1145 domain-containing protein [Deltaproteobacteria bacterium]
MATLGKLLVAIVWLVTGWAFLLPPSHPWTTVGRGVLVFMLAVHAIEALVFLPRLRAAGGSLASHLARTLLFGFLHVGGLPREEARQ